MELGAAMPGPSDGESKIETLVRDDRRNLNSFVESLNNGVSFDEMDDDLKRWWLARY